MKRFCIYILAGLGISLAACTKDKGNYSYHTPVAPVVTHLDTAYNATVGDTLIIQPTVTIADPSHVLGYEWRIDVPEQLKAIYFYGVDLRMLFDLNAQRYSGRLTVIDSTNGMKYVYPFVIKGGTIYSNGTFILSQENGVSQLSFVEPDGTMQARVYNTINQEDLPPNAQQILPMYDVNINNGTYFGYWVLCSSGSNPGVEMDANSLTKKMTLADNFFSTPATMTPGLFIGNSSGTLEGVLNGQLYSGTSQTAYFSSTYGKFGLSAGGDSALFRQACYNSILPYILAYDTLRQKVVAFTVFGMPAYIGTGYTSTATTPFDLTKVGLKMLEFEQINDGNVYMFGKNGNDSVYEMMFTPAFLGYIQVTPKYTRPFVRQDLIAADTKWAGSKWELFYFTNGSTVYEYVPANQLVRQVAIDFGGKSISMLKVSSDGNTLTVGVNGSLFLLDVTNGQNATLTKRIDNIPGSPVDVYTRSN